MKNFNLQNLEKELKKLDLPDFELPQRKKLLRQNLLSSPYFKKERSLFPFFKIALAPVGAVCLILLFVFLGYPYVQSFYSEAKAQNILNRAETAIENLGENKEIYARISGDNAIDTISNQIPSLQIEVSEKSQILPVELTEFYLSGWYKLCNPENFDYFEYFEKKLKGFNAQILTMESWPPQFQFSGLTSENCPKVREIVIASGLTQKVSECRERPLYPTWPEPEETVEEVIRVERVEKVISKIEFNFNELNEAKKKGEVKFLQYAGREEINNTTLEKIRYTNKEGTIITEIKIDSKTNLPVEINNWGPKEIIKKPKDIINVPRDIDSQITEDGVKLREDGEKLIETDINVEVIIIEKEKNQDTSPESPEQEENLEDLPPCTIAE